jgi:hypothetical protein
MDLPRLLAQLPQQLLNGIFAGSIYALFALGYTLVFGVLDILNRPLTKICRVTPPSRRHSGRVMDAKDASETLALRVITLLVVY